MRERSPQVTYKEEFRYEGCLSFGLAEIAVDSFVIDYAKYGHSKEMTFSTSLRSDFANKMRSIFQSSSLTFRCKIFGEMEVVADCVPLRANNNVLEGIVQTLDVGLNSLPEVPVVQTITVKFTPTNLAVPQVDGLVQWYTGEVKPFEGTGERIAMNLATPFGKATFSQFVSYERACIGDVEANVHIPVPTWYLELDRSSITAEIGSLVKCVTAYLESFEVLVSFLSRRQVRWVELEVVSEFVAEGRSEIKQARRIRSAPGSEAPDRELIVPVLLEENDLGDLLETLVESPYREPLSHAITYLNSHWRGGFIEGKLANSFTAFETLVNGICAVEGDDLTMPDREFQKLRKALEGRIKEASSELGLDKAGRAELYSKLAEIQRRPLVPKAVGLVNKFSVDWRDLWSTDTSISEALGSAYKRRSRFVHSGLIDDYELAVRDTERIHALSEKIIYNVLGAKKEWLHLAAYYNAQ